MGISLAGKYEREGARLRGEREFIIVKRPPKERTRAKSGEYLLEVKPNGKRRYVSSLWETTEEDVYTIEYQRTRYRVHIASAEAYFDEVTYTRS
jgi:hypothetical protein